MVLDFTFLQIIMAYSPFLIVPTGIPTQMTASAQEKLIVLQWPHLPAEDFLWKDYPEHRQYRVNFTLFYQDSIVFGNTTIHPSFWINWLDPFQLLQIQVAALTRRLGNFSEPACFFTYESGRTLCRF